MEFSNRSEVKRATRLGAQRTPAARADGAWVVGIIVRVCGRGGVKRGLNGQIGVSITAPRSG